MSDNQNDGGSIDDLRIDPVTGKFVNASGKSSGTDINSVSAKGTPSDTDATEKPESTTIVVQGTPGRGIQSAEVVNDHLILTFTDGATYDCGPVGGTDGEDGTDGTNGVGIASATVNNLGHLVLTLTNNSLVDAGVVAGPGFVGANIDGSGHLILTNTDAEQIDLGPVKGTAGTNGKTILSGTVDPTTEGTNGDFYLNTATMLLFGPKTSGSWGAGTLLKGTDGLNGKTLLSGASNPTGGLGSNGDFYLNTTTSTLFGPKGTPSAGWNTGVVLKGVDGEDGSDVTGVLADWRALPSLYRKIHAAQFNKGTVTIKIAGIGSSNMFNEGGGLSGVGNSPVEVLLRNLKAELDPFDFCTWDFRNFGVNGSAFSGWNVRLNGNPKSPQEYLEEYEPDLVMLCYGTNDYSPEAFNTGQTRALATSFMNAIYEWCSYHDIDVVNMIPPQPHVAKSKQTLVDPSDGQTKTGRALNFTVPLQYPLRSYQVGQGAFTESMTFTSDNKITAATVGLFNNTYHGFGLEVGKTIVISDSNLGAITNGGTYRIKSIDVTGTVLEVDNVMNVGGLSLEVGAPAAFTDFGPANVCIRRIAIDPFTELSPSFTEAFGFVDVDGTPVEVSTRASIVAEDIRQATAASQYYSSLIDTEAYYFKAVAKNGEDRYYATLETVHWNSVCVEEVIEPAIRDWVRSLSASARTIVGGGIMYRRELIVRPNAPDYQTRTELKATDAIDLQIATGKRAVVRGSDGKVTLEIKDNGDMIQHRVNAIPFKRVPLVRVVANTAVALETTMTIPGAFHGYAFAQQPGIGYHLKRISGVFDGTTVTVFSEDEAMSTTAVFAVSGSGDKLVLTPGSSNTQMWLDIMQLPTTYGALED